MDLDVFFAVRLSCTEQLPAVKLLFGVPVKCVSVLANQKEASVPSLKQVNDKEPSGATNVENDNGESTR